MVREDILGGLKIALSKGQSLESAMQSFYNAGYKKEEIEEAARALYSSMSQQPYQPVQPNQQPIQEKKFSKDEVNIQPSLVKVPQVPVTPVSPPPMSQRQLQSQQVVSSYEHPKKKVDFVAILLVIILLILLGVLVSVFFFKPQIVDFLNKYFK